MPQNKTPVRPASREAIYDVIDGERDYQNARWPDQNNAAQPNPLTIGESILLIEEYAARARALWSGETKPEHGALDIMRKLAGIAVHCMEEHGAIPREWHVPQSAGITGTVALRDPGDATNKRKPA